MPPTLWCASSMRSARPGRQCRTSFSHRSSVTIWAQLLADSLHCEPERAAPLAELIHEKTTGNPFFAIQFISALADEGLLTFDHGEGRWVWDLRRIHAKGFTDNVVELMVGKLNRLPVETQKALQRFACMGNSAEFEMLQMVHQGSDEELH